MVYPSAYFSDRSRRIYLLQQFQPGPENHPAFYLAGNRGSFTEDKAAAV
jgi:hypothetical protein